MKFHSTVELGGKTDLALALSLDHAAPEFFETLSHSHRRAYVDWISRWSAGKRRPDMARFRR